MVKEKKTSDAPRRTKRTLRFEIDGHQFASELKPAAGSESAIWESPRLVLWCSPVGAADRLKWYINVVPAADCPSLKDFAVKGSARVGHVLFESNVAQAEVCVGDVWRLLDAVREGTITHVELALQPDSAEFDLIEACVFASQPHIALDIPRDEVE